VVTATGVHALSTTYGRTIDPARALTAETLALERTLSELVNQAYAPDPGGDCVHVENRSAPHTRPPHAT
jgi:hypothetical protein